MKLFTVLGQRISIILLELSKSEVERNTLKANVSIALSRTYEFSAVSAIIVFQVSAIFKYLQAIPALTLNPTNF